MNITIQGIPDGTNMRDIATKLYHEFGSKIGIRYAEQEQDEKSLHVQVAEILGHIHNRDYGMAESKAGLLRDQLRKGDWTLGDGKAEKFDEECVGCCKVVDVAANLQKELDEYKETLRVERIDHTCERTAVNRKYHKVIRERDSLIESLRAGAKANALRIEDLKKTIEDLKKTIDELREKNKRLFGDGIKDAVEIAHRADIIGALEAELSARKQDSEVLMKVVEIIKDESVDNNKAANLIANIVGYFDAPEAPQVDVFEQAMEYRIANLDQAIIDGNYSTEDHAEGQKGGFEYALAIYRDCRKRGIL